MIILFGSEIKLITVIKHIPELQGLCPKHHLGQRIVIGKKFYHIFFIPINYFWAPERVFLMCPSCIDEYYELLPQYEKIILDYYHKKISSKTLHKKIREQLKEDKKQKV